MCPENDARDTEGTWTASGEAARILAINTGSSSLKAGIYRQSAGLPHEAVEHCAAGASVWAWASNDEKLEPDVVLAAPGTCRPWRPWPRPSGSARRVPDLKVRVVNVVDLMTLFPPEHHPHGMSETRFVDLFTADKPVVFAFHGYQRAVHEIVHGRVRAERFHVRGFTEQGTTTTPFDMAILNGMSRYHLAIEALRRATRLRPQADAIIAELENSIVKATAYAREHLEDPPDIRDWTWSRR